MKRSQILVYQAMTPFMDYLFIMRVAFEKSTY